MLASQHHYPYFDSKELMGVFHFLLKNHTSNSYPFRNEKNLDIPLL